jgi:hypothetical protein
MFILPHLARAVVLDALFLQPAEYLMQSLMRL